MWFGCEKSLDWICLANYLSWWNWVSSMKSIMMARKKRSIIIISMINHHNSEWCEWWQREKRGAGDGRQKIDEDIQVLKKLIPPPENSSCKKQNKLYVLFCIHISRFHLLLVEKDLKSWFTPVVQLDWFLMQAAEDKSNHLNRIKVSCKLGLIATGGIMKI